MTVTARTEAPWPTDADDASADRANSVLGKVRLILEAFDLDEDGLTLSELCRRTGISKASVHRLSQELVEWGMLERSGTAYQLGLRAFELGSRASRMRELRESLRPHMETVHFATKETVHLAVRDGFDVLYLEKVNSHAQQTRPSRIAGRMPLHCTATGKILLAFGSPSLFDAVVAHGLGRVSRSTVVLPRLLAEQLTRARQTGFAIEKEETTPGYASIAIPLFGDGTTVTAAISVTAPVFRADFSSYAAALVDVRRKTGLERSASAPSGVSASVRRPSR